MKYNIHIEKELAIVHVSGQATAKGFSETTEALVSSPKWTPGMNILIDYSDLDLSNAASTNVNSFARALAPHRDQLGSGLCACVNTKPLNFGLGRMWQVFMEEHSNLKVAVFYDINEAKNWLQSEKGN